MFKPTLKRSQLTTTSTSQYNRQWHTNLYDDSSLKRSIPYNHQSSLIIPPQLFKNQVAPSKEPIFTPLNYEWCPYPKNALQMINSQPQGEFIARDIGNYQDLFWFFNGYQIMLWNEPTGFTKRFQMPQKSEIVSFGQLQSSSLHFKSKKPIIMVAGCQNFIHLFGLNRQTLACEDFKFCYQISNSSYIQKITFHNKNQIIVVSNTGQHWLFDFKSQFKAYRQESNLLNKNLPSLPFLFPQSHFFYQKVLVSDRHIVSLVREERKANWFTYKAKQLINVVFGQNNSPQWIVEQKKIQIYQVDRTNKSIILVHRIKESELIKKCKLNIPHWENQNSESQIVSINLKNKDILEISLKSGVFLQIDFQKQLTLQSQPLVIPSHQIVGMTGFFLQKKINEKNLIEQGNHSKVYFSLGSDNLTLLGDSLCLISQNSIQIVKNCGFEGLIYERKNRLLSQRSWFFLTNKGFFKIQRLSPKEVIVGFITEREKLDSKNINKKWTDENHFQLFIETLNSSIGPDKVIQSLIELVVSQTQQIRLNHHLLTFMSKELQGMPAENVRDWSYQLSITKSKNEEILSLSPKIKEQIWSLIINNSNKTSKAQPIDFSGNNKVVSAYWQALKSFFERITLWTLELEPKDVKSNLHLITEMKRLMKGLCSFFEKKRERQTRWSNQFYVFQKEQREQKPDFLSYFKRKNYITSAPNKKLQESTETQPESVTQSKIVTQSSRSLENDIIEAVDKINLLMEVFVILSDVSETENLPCLAKIFKSKQSQRCIKHKLFQKLTDKVKLQQLNKALPELQLFKDIRLAQWLENSKKYKFVDMFNLQEISYWISSHYFKQVFAVFSERVDLQADLLLHYWTRMSESISLSSHLFELETKKGTKYTSDIKNSLNENIKYCTGEQKIIANELQNKIITAINGYINSEEEKYHQAEKVLNRTIQLIASKGDELINAFLLSELIKGRVTEKVVYLKKLKKKTAPQVSVEDILLRRQPKKIHRNPLETMDVSNAIDILDSSRQA